MSQDQNKDGASNEQPSHSRSRSRDRHYIKNRHCRPRYTIYVLKLTGGKYYVGRTVKPVADRFEQHTSGQLAAVWSRRHRPVKIIQSMRSGEGLTELSVTKEYMARYGIDNVRGSCYCRAELSGVERERLEFDIREIRAELDLCYYCGGSHYSYKCSEPIVHIDAGSQKYELRSEDLLTLQEIIEMAKNSSGNKHLQSTQHSKDVLQTAITDKSQMKSSKLSQPIETTCFTDLLPVQITIPSTLQQDQRPTQEPLD